MSSEAELVDLLVRRYSQERNGISARYACASHVPSHPGGTTYSARVIDFLAIDTWRSGNYAVHAHEIKVSRSDWLRELAQPHKAGTWADLADFFWLVTADPSIAKVTELPEAWGLMTMRGGALTVTHKARPLRDTARNPLTGEHPTLFGRAQVAAIARAAARTGREAAKAELRQREALLVAAARALDNPPVSVGENGDQDA